MRAGVLSIHVEPGGLGCGMPSPTAQDRVDGVFFTGSHHRRGLSLSCTTWRPLSTRSRHTLGLAVGSLNPTPTEGAQ